MLVYRRETANWQVKRLRIGKEGARRDARILTHAGAPADIAGDFEKL